MRQQDSKTTRDELNCHGPCEDMGQQILLNLQPDLFRNKNTDETSIMLSDEMAFIPPDRQSGEGMPGLLP